MFMKFTLELLFMCHERVFNIHHSNLTMMANFFLWYPWKVFHFISWAEFTCYDSMSHDHITRFIWWHFLSCLYEKTGSFAPLSKKSGIFSGHSTAFGSCWLSQ